MTEYLDLVLFGEPPGKRIKVRRDTIIAVKQNNPGCSIYLSSGHSFDLADAYADVCQWVFYPGGGE